MNLRSRLLAATALAVLALTAMSSTASAAPHVFVIVLENEDADTTFGPSSPAPYLATTLRSQGAFVPNYYGIGHNSLDNYLAMVSGQSPTLAFRLQFAAVRGAPGIRLSPPFATADFQARFQAERS